MESEISSQPRREKILIIECDGSFGEHIKDGLEARGYEVILTKTCNDGLRAIYDSLPHLILLDADLPNDDSYAIIQKKQAERLLVKIPVFLLSMRGEPLNMHKIPEGSVEEYIVVMHIDPKDIIARIDKHFGHKSIAEADKNKNAGPKKKIAWLEDDKLIGTILGKKLLSSNFDLILTRTGQEMLDHLKRFVPDVIVLDLMLPEMDGFTVLQKIRMDERLDKVPVMILSNLDKPSDLEKAKMLGVSKYLVKAATSLEQIVAEVAALCK